jgi:hypothetical protein
MRYKLAIAAAMLGLASPAFAEAWDFLMTNNTGKEIKLIEVSPAGAGKWQPNKVDEGEKPKNIKVAARATVHFDKDSSCKWDVKATFVDDSSAVWSNINLCDVSSLTLRYANGTPSFVIN